MGEKIKIKKKNTFNLFLNLLLVCSLLFIVGCASSVYLKNKGQGNTYITLQNGQLSAGPVTGNEDSGLWDVEIVDANHVRLKKHGTNQYLHIKNGPLECSVVPGTDTSTHWKMSNQDNNSNFKLESRTRQGHVLHVERNNLMLSDAVMGEKTQWTMVNKQNLNDVEDTPSRNLTEQQKNAIKNILGQGYHAEQGYANIKYTTTCLFDLDAVAKTAQIVTIDETEFESKTIFGSSMQKYSQKLSASISVDATVGLFSGGINTTFGTSSSKSTSDSYCTIQDVMGYFLLKMGTDVPLRDDVKNDIDNMDLDPMDLFETYGTHYIQSAYIGARVSYHTKINHSVFTNEEDFKASVTAAYEAFSASASLEIGNKSYNEESSKNSTVQIFGGDPGLREILKGVGDEDKSKIYEEWYASIKQHMNLADYGYKGLRPISELATNPLRQKQLLDAITAFLKSQSVSLPGTNPIVMKNSTVMIQSANGAFLTRPVFRSFPAIYYPLTSNSDSSGDFRVRGHFTFNKSSSEPLNSDNVVSITFDETELWPGWNEGKAKKEVNQDWYKHKYLKSKGGTAFETPFAHYTEAGDWAKWTIKKVEGSIGDPIYSGDEVRIYASAIDQYLNPAVSGALWVNSITETDKNFVWKIIVVDPE